MPRTTAVAALLMLLGACAQQTGTATPGPGSEAIAQGAMITATGSFAGASGHETTGHASIGRLGDQWVVILEDDFRFDGAPDPQVALGSDGYRPEARLAALEANDGRQVYAIPASLDVADFNEVWIWCEEFSVPLGVARLTLT